MYQRDTWFLVSDTDGIVDEAGAKSELMSKYGYKTSFRDGLIYTVFLGKEDSKYIIREKDMKKSGYGWALIDYRRKGH